MGFMKFACGSLPQGVLMDPDNQARLAKHAEDLGFEYLWVNDHIVMPRSIGSVYPYSETGEFYEHGEAGDYLEQLTVLGFLAGHTSRIRLVTSVMVVPYRDPVHTAKILATIDVLSGGRLSVGCGAGWMREEFEALGRPPFEERGAITDEYVSVFKELWTSDDPRFDGKYVRFANIAFEPKPVQKPHPPIWIGGESAPALRRAVRHGDGWFPIGNNPRFPLDTPDLFAARMARLREISEAEGRDPSTIDVTYALGWYNENEAETGSDGRRRSFTGSAAQIASDIRAYRDLGVGCIMFEWLTGSAGFEEALERMERFVTEVRPLVEG